jgi:hypothetical protein
LAVLLVLLIAVTVGFSGEEGKANKYEDGPSLGEAVGMTSIVDGHRWGEGLARFEVDLAGVGPERKEVERSAGSWCRCLIIKEAPRLGEGLSSLISKRGGG